MAKKSFIAQFCFALATVFTLFVFLSPDDLFLQRYVAPASSVSTNLIPASMNPSYSVNSVKEEAVHDQIVEEVVKAEPEVVTDNFNHEPKSVEEVSSGSVTEMKEEEQTNEEESKSTQETFQSIKEGDSDSSLATVEEIVEIEDPLATESIATSEALDDFVHVSAQYGPTTDIAVLIEFMFLVDLYAVA